MDKEQHIRNTRKEIIVSFYKLIEGLGNREVVLFFLPLGFGAYSRYILGNLVTLVQFC